MGASSIQFNNSSGFDKFVKYDCHGIKYLGFGKFSSYFKLLFYYVVMADTIVCNC